MDFKSKQSDKLKGSFYSFTLKKKTYLEETLKSLKFDQPHLENLNPIIKLPFFIFQKKQNSPLEKRESHLLLYKKFLLETMKLNLGSYLWIRSKKIYFKESLVLIKFWIFHRI